MSLSGFIPTPPPLAVVFFRTLPLFNSIPFHELVGQIASDIAIYLPLVSLASSSAYWPLTWCGGEVPFPERVFGDVLGF